MGMAHVSIGEPKLWQLAVAGHHTQELPRTPESFFKQLQQSVLSQPVGEPELS